MTNLLIVDLETTGLEPSKDKVVELGGILYSVKHHCVLQQVSTLFPVKENPAQSVNRIPVGASQAIGEKEHKAATEFFYNLLDRSDYIVAHNADFDRQWLTKSERFKGYNKPWLCTLEDFLWPENPKPTNLVATALNHGIGVSCTHRALTDCQLIAALFDRIEYHQPGKLKELVAQAIERSTEPKIYVIAHVVVEQNDLAKDRGFRWNKYIERKWVKLMRQREYEAEKGEYPFPTTVQKMEP